MKWVKLGATVYIGGMAVCYLLGLKSVHWSFGNAPRFSYLLSWPKHIAGDIQDAIPRAAA